MVSRQFRVLETVGSSPAASTKKEGQSLWLSFFFVESVIRLEHSCFSNSGFAYPTRRSTSSLVRRRVWIYCSFRAKSRLVQSSLWLSFFFFLSKPARTRTHIAHLCYVSTLPVTDICSHFARARVGVAFSAKSASS